MYGRDQLHTGRSPYLDPQTSKLEWFYRTEEGRIEVTPAVGADGTVYFGSVDSTLAPDSYFYALNPDGTLKWRVKTLGDAFSMAALGWNGTIYVTH